MTAEELAGLREQHGSGMNQSCNVPIERLLITLDRFAAASRELRARAVAVFDAFYCREPMAPAWVRAAFHDVLEKTAWLLEKTS